jgi:hypothetical protein
MKVIEECGELQQALCKAERFGWDTVHKGMSNRIHVSWEMGDVEAAINALRLSLNDE